MIGFNNVRGKVQKLTEGVTHIGQAYTPAQNMYAISTHLDIYGLGVIIPKQ